ncbi:hypothetical protein QYE76_062814 [Lolium multiflorum]|uniref:Transposase (putative) gypsy type domain-containing protein n=1 Tax=Lolium multiflorum TaxID=4521 RepID=A0AAD8S4A7_LOLMU|nr:hypothetical protein QYE76_062814 [Lolium multiflorum]
MTKRTKRIKPSVAGSSAHVEKQSVSGWERSKFSKGDQRTLKEFGLLTTDGAMQVPGDEAVPNPPEGFRLYEMSPNSILHISISVTLCEYFLVIHPHWGLGKRIFYLRRNHSRNTIYNVGGVCICVRPEAGYFDLKFADSVKGGHTKWMYIKDESTSTQEYGLAPFYLSQDILRDDDEALELDAPKPTNTSTSHTLVLSEDPKIAPESSEPPRNPRVLKKKARTGAAGKEQIATRSLLTPFLDDPVMKEMVDIGSRLIRALDLGEKRANDLERKLKANKEARKKG